MVNLNVSRLGVRFQNVRGMCCIGFLSNVITFKLERFVPGRRENSLIRLFDIAKRVKFGKLIICDICLIQFPFKSNFVNMGCSSFGAYKILIKNNVTIVKD